MSFVGSRDDSTSVAGRSVHSGWSGGSVGTLTSRVDGAQNTTDGIIGRLPTTTHKAQQRLLHFQEETEMLKRQIESMEVQLKRAEAALHKTDYSTMELQDHLRMTRLMDEQAEKDLDKLVKNTIDQRPTPWDADHIPPKFLAGLGTILDDPRPTAFRLEGLLLPSDYPAIKRFRENYERWYHKPDKAAGLPPEPPVKNRVVTVFAGADTALKFGIPYSEQYTFGELLMDCCYILGVRSQDFVLQMNHSKMCLGPDNVQDVLVETSILGTAEDAQLTPKELFDRFDKDSSGEIDLTEFVDLFESLNHNVPRDRIASIFNIVDADGSGTIVYSEFRKNWPALLKALQDMISDDLPPVFLIPVRNIYGREDTEATARQLRSVDITPEQAWQVFDRDASQTIEFVEFAEVFRRYLKSSVSYGKLRRIFRLIDQDNSGKIEYAEFEQNWDLVAAEIDNSLEVIDAEEVLDDLGEALGLSVLKKVEAGPLQPREKSLVRSGCAFICFLVLFITVVYLRRDMGGAYRLSFAIKDKVTLANFGGPPFNGSNLVTTYGQTGYTVSETEPFFMYWREDYQDIVDEVSVWSWANGPLLDTLFGADCNAGIATRNCSDSTIAFSNKVVGLFELSRSENPERSCPTTATGELSTRFATCQPTRPAPYPEVVVLSHDLGEFKRVFARMESDAWIRLNTDRVVVKGTVYNGNVNLFLTFKFSITITPAGRFSVDKSLTPLRIDMFATNEDRLYLGLETMVLAFAIYLAYEDFARARVYKAEHGSFIGFYTGSLLNMASLLFTILYLTSVVSRFAFFFYPARDKFDILTPRVVDLTGMATVYNMAFNLEATCILLAVFRLMSYLEAGKWFGVVWQTLVRSSMYTIFYLIMFALFLSGFVLVGFTVFGPSLFRFSDMFLATRTCMMMTLGQFSYEEMTEVDDTWAPAFVFTYFFVLYFIFRNIFVAIINDAYQQIIYNARRTSQYSVSAWTLRGIVGAIFPPLDPRRPANKMDDGAFDGDIGDFVADVEREELEAERRREDERELAIVLGNAAKAGHGSQAVKTLLGESESEDEEKGFEDFKFDN